MKVLVQIVIESGLAIDDSLIGGNASAEEPQEAGDDPAAVSGINVVLRHRLVETGFKNKKEYQIHIKVLYVNHIISLCHKPLFRNI